MLRAIVIAALVAVCSSQLGDLFGSFACRRYQYRNCDYEREHQECGTDGVTYRNLCAFTKVRCGGKKIDIAFRGSCDKRPTTGGAGVSGEEAVLDYFCIELSHEKCPNETETLCGSDGKTYANLCEYEKTKCTHRDLHVADFGACSS
ncbi:follistatin-like [Haliotis cracherodii]|uniref:follistatin-like n=1 Tax=Haliotis cracherodii TaxID=6455 RepID=UPI0039EC4FBF